MLFAGVAFSAAALYELHELDSTIDEVKSRQNLLVRQVDSLTDDMAITVRNVKKLYGAIQMMKANAMSQASIITLESAVLQMTSDSQRFFTGLDDLLDHKLSMELVDEDDMNKDVGRRVCLSPSSLLFSRSWELVVYKLSLLLFEIYTTVDLVDSCRAVVLIAHLDKGYLKVTVDSIKLSEDFG